MTGGKGAGRRLTPGEERLGAEMFAAGASEREVARALGVGNGTANRLKHRLRIPVAPVPQKPQVVKQPAPEPEHGTLKRYKRGCRCADCRAINAAAATNRRAQFKGQPPETVEHGAACYTNYGCRCDICTKAHTERCKPASQRWQKKNPDKIRARRRRRDARLLESATRYGYQWTGPELELAARQDLTSVQVAEMIGRTHAAVQWMRHKLRDDPKIINLAGATRR